ncbi:MAG: SDR family oxidoreductase [Betaproteobacteria bacterium]|jgi:NAD(P)-dependent dehydrogenase (short-subunit alcohol dehydrogenase family)|nr:SDR family oxidoreductase [Betaproteobacteria bacterium]
MAEWLSGKVALVTGARRGIGLAIAHNYLRQGARVVALCSHPDGVAQMQAALGGGDQLVCMALDVRDEAACRQLTQDVLARMGRIDILVNNAGIYRSKSFLNHSANDFRELMEVNLFGVLHMTQAVLPHLIEQRWGRIINIASTAGKWGSRLQSAYNTSKHAVVGLTRCVALETAQTGVTVNAICPGFVQTDMVEELKAQTAAASGDPEALIKNVLSRVPMNRILHPDEVASLALYLASDAASAITAQSLLVDGGMLMT